MSVNLSSRVPATTARIFLGLVYFIFGLNFFFHFIPAGPSPAGKAAAFLGGLFQSGYLFPLIKVLEIAGGLLLLAGLFLPLVQVVLFPITLNIFLFHGILEPNAFGLALASLMLLAQVYLAYSYRDYYRHLFVAKAAI